MRHPAASPRAAATLPARLDRNDDASDMMNLHVPLGRLEGSAGGSENRRRVGPNLSLTKYH